MELIPLVKSAEYDDVEREFKALFLFLYKKYINAKVDEVALYGMPHIGPSSLIERHVSSDGLAVMASTTADKIRYLFHAWRYRNPQRGTAFLRAYLNTLFGPVFTIEQLWCPIEGIYPEEAISEPELLALGEDLDEYFLTSRLQVDIDTETLPARIVEAAKTAVGAKFVLDVRLAKTIHLDTSVSHVAWGAQIVGAAGHSLYYQRQIRSGVEVGVTSALWGEQVVRASGHTIYHQRDVLADIAVGAAMRAVADGEAVNVVHAKGAQIIRGPQVNSSTPASLANQPGVATLTYSTIPRVDMQTYLK